MNCPSCQSLNPVGAKYCSQCGASLQADDGRPKRRFGVTRTDEHYVVTLGKRPPMRLPKEPVERAGQAAMTAIVGFLAERRARRGKGPRR